MLYATKCYWPGVSPGRPRAGRPGVPPQASLAAGSNGVIYLGSLLFAADDLVLCMFQGHSRAAHQG